MREIDKLLARFGRLKEAILRHKRIQGIYILEAAAVPESATDLDARYSFLRSFAAPFGFSEPKISEAEWRDAEVFREEVQGHLVAALVGGAEIGHSCWDVPPDEASAIADEFVGLFGDDARFFADRSPTRNSDGFGPAGRADLRDYIFDGGCVAVDSQLAAVFWMLDSD